MVLVGRPDQREIAFIGDREKDASVGQLEEIGIVVVEQFAHDDMRPADEAHPVVGFGIGAPEQVEHCRSEEHTSELQSLMRISYAVFCLKKKKQNIKITT